MASDLPGEVDVVVLGTGMPESILAAAFSRNGYSVLHLDRNNFYGGGWASFHNVALDNFAEERRGLVKEVAEEKIAELTKDGERAVRLPVDVSHVTSIKTNYWCKEKPQVEEVAGKVSECHITTEQGQPGSPQHQGADCIASAGVGPEVSTEVTSEVSSEVSTEVSTEMKAKDSKTEASAAKQAAPALAEGVEEGQFDPAEEGTDGGQAQRSEDQAERSEVPEERPGTPSQAWYREDLQRDFRRFSLDLAPKVLYSCGKMVELLISSDVAKYCDFRTVSCVLTRLHGRLEKVPCSRADVFRTKRIPVKQKRPLMKFLTFCANYESQPEEYRDFVGKPFAEFLESKGFSAELKHFFQYPMAMATSTTPTERGLHNIHKFIKSMGRYGNSSFLFPLYGAGELPQGFCRLSAVFGGIYCLQTTAVAMLLDENNKCKAVITSEGQRIGCKWLVMEASYAPADFVQHRAAQISRGILVTDRTLSPEDDQELSLLHLPVEAEPERPITVLELPSSSMVCPQRTYVVHVTRVGSGDAEADLQPALQALFSSADTAEDGRPRLLWGGFLSLQDLSCVAPSPATPSNVLLLPGPGPYLDMDAPVDEARQLFETVLPGEQFLPKPPHPDDIIFVDDEETPAAGREGEGQAGWEETPAAGSQGEATEATAQAEGEATAPPAEGDHQTSPNTKASAESETSPSDSGAQKSVDSQSVADPNQGSS